MADNQFIPGEEFLPIGFEPRVGLRLFVKSRIERTKDTSYIVIQHVFHLLI